MGKIAILLSDYIIHKGIIDEKERNAYEYGFVIAGEILLNLFISISIAMILHMMVEGILFFIIFIPLRTYAGGLHLNYYWSCLILSCIVFTAVLLGGKFIELPTFLSLAMVLFLEYSILCLYPVENENRLVDQVENHYFKSRLKIFLLMDLLITILCVLFDKKEYLVIIVATFLLTTVTMSIGKYRNSKKVSY